MGRRGRPKKSSGAGEIIQLIKQLEGAYTSTLKTIRKELIAARARVLALQEHKEKGVDDGE